MLSKPRHGWTEVYIGNIFLGMASYIDDVPFLFLERLIAYFRMQKEGYPAEFSLCLDCEGYNIGLLSFDRRLYFLDTREECSELFSYKGEVLGIKEISPATYHLPLYSNAFALLKKISQEVIADIEKYLDDWVSFLPEIEFLKEEEIENRRKRLLSDCKTLKNLIKE